MWAEVLCQFSEAVVPSMEAFPAGQHLKRLVDEIYEEKWFIFEKKNPVAQQDPERMTAKFVSHVIQVRRLKKKHKYSPSIIIAIWIKLRFDAIW